MRAQQTCDVRTRSPRLTLDFFASESDYVRPTGVRTRLAAKDTLAGLLRRRHQNSFVECDCACK